MQSYIEGRFGRMEGEDITDEALEKANKRLLRRRAGIGEDGVIKIPDDEASQEE
jgi:hypothetical protein